eukprot:8311498-Pyramimonas_sp.AAC.1
MVWAAARALCYNNFRRNPLFWGHEPRGARAELASGREVRPVLQGPSVKPYGLTNRSNGARKLHWRRLLSEDPPRRREEVR